MVHYISGGARSGKSGYAQKVALEYDKRAYLATAEAFDDEMKIRIQRHKDDRREQFVTIEEPLNIAKAVVDNAQDFDIILIDCLTVWLSNLMFYSNSSVTLNTPEVEAFINLLENPPTSIVIVSNELGMGIVPIDSMTREYRDLAGLINQAVAQRAGKVTFMVSGLPLEIK